MSTVSRKPERPPFGSLVFFALLPHPARAPVQKANRRQGQNPGEQNDVLDQEARHFLCSSIGLSPHHRSAERILRPIS